MTKTTSRSQPHSRSCPRSHHFNGVLAQLLRGCLYALPATLFFSYYPIISLGANASMNFELSLPLLWLVVFDGLALPYFFSSGACRQFFTSFSHFPELPRLSKLKLGACLLLALFPVYITFSILWSANPLRGFLTAGVLWLVILAAIGIFKLAPHLCSRFPLIRIFFISTTIICVFCFFQSILDLCGVGRNATLLCAGCTYRSFGFPHPSGFAIEPQFMGNLLLAPSLFGLYLLTFSPNFSSPPAPPVENSHQPCGKPVQNHKTFVHKQDSSVQNHHTPCAYPVYNTNISVQKYLGKSGKDVEKSTKLVKKPLSRRSLVMFTFVCILTLFFTFSRGAIYAFTVGLGVLIICYLITWCHIKRRHDPADTVAAPTRIVANFITIPLFAALFALILQGTFAALGPTSETFFSATAKSIHHLSLGLVDLRPSSQSAHVTDSHITTDMAQDQPSESASTQETAAFNGYVAESTNVRLSLNSVALATWRSTGKNLWFGVGLGGAGIAMHAYDPTSVTSAKEIVQNQPISLLLELGIVGILCLIITAITLIFLPGPYSSVYFPVENSHQPCGKTVQNHKTSVHKQDSSVQNHHTSCAYPVYNTNISVQKYLGKSGKDVYIAALGLAYLISLQFFSGLPNALHIYLLPPLFFAILPSIPCNLEPISKSAPKTTENSLQTRKKR